MRIIAGLIALVFAATPVAGQSPEKAKVVVHPEEVKCKLHPELFGVNLAQIKRKAWVAQDKLVNLAKAGGFRSIRFPNGCFADQYNWLSPPAGDVSVDEFLEFCEKLGAEPYYTLNLQGGTEGKEGKVTAEMPLDEIIRYRHLAPNPCGWTNHYFGTLPETLQLVEKYTIERALAGKLAITVYEMGNENWGQSTTDWPPHVYAKTVEVWSRAMRDVVRMAKEKHPDKLKDLKLTIIAVGFPMHGNNQKMVDTPDYKINSAWTKGLNDLAEQGIIDAVQEHFYPYGNADGGTMAWVHHNLANILDARHGNENPRLGGYRDETLKYAMPIEFTEWNVKCWGKAFNIEKQLTNGDFEKGTEGWGMDGKGKVTVSAKAARRGKAGLRVEGRTGEWIEVSRAFKREKFENAAAGVWVWTKTPEAVKVYLREKRDEPVPENAMCPPNASMWQRVVAGKKLEGGTFEMVLRVEGKAEVYFDEAILYSLETAQGSRPIVSDTYGQQMFTVDALRQMAEYGVQRAHLHHLFGGYGCTMIQPNGTTYGNYPVFVFFKDFYGDRVVKTEVESPTYRYDHRASKWSSDFNALCPPVEKVPAFSAMASRTDDAIYLLMINRFTDREVEADIDLGAPVKGTAAVRTMVGKDLELPGAEIQESKMRAKSRFKDKVPPLSARIIAMPLARK